MPKSNSIRFKLYLSVFVTLLIIGILGFMLVEGFSLTDAIYFSIVTMATVGYGDIHPQSELGKILALIIIIGGVGTFLGVIASITDLFVNRREERLRQQKINMVTGLFFSEIGTELLRRFVRSDPKAEKLGALLKITDQWGKADFDRSVRAIADHQFTIASRHEDLDSLRDYLQDRVELLLRLIENPVIHEHGNFTEMLRAVFHLRDELLNRSSFSDLPDSDRRHLDGDIVRIYRLLVFEWLRYMRYLKHSYGYMFSLAMRTNPFDFEAEAVVTDAR